MYTKYDRSLSEVLDVSVFSRFKLHSLDNENHIVIHRSYAGTGRFGLAELLSDEPARWSTLFFFRQAREMRTEAKLFYSPTVDFRLISGLEFRSSQIQGEYTVSLAQNPSETGFAFDELNDFDQRNIGLYAQASYNPRSDLEMTLGGRIDNNRVRESLGFGTVFTPRVATVYHPGNFIFKVIYAEAFKAASNSARFSTSPSRLVTSPDLEPERVKNLDLSAGWQITERLSVDLVGYQANYSDIIGAAAVTLEDGTTTTQNRSIGALRIRGLQASASLQARRVSMYGNYTYTNPLNVEVVDALGTIVLDDRNGPAERRIGDIASHRLNLGGSLEITPDVDVSTFVRHVGSRQTGVGTTVPDNPRRRIPSYTTIGGTLTVDGHIPGVSMQLRIDNALDAKYFHPGVRSAEGTIHVDRLPQNRRTMILRLLYDLH